MGRGDTSDSTGTLIGGNPSAFVPSGNLGRKRWTSNGLALTRMRQLGICNGAVHRTCTARYLEVAGELSRQSAADQAAMSSEARAWVAANIAAAD